MKSSTVAAELAAEVAADKSSVPRPCAGADVDRHLGRVSQTTRTIDASTTLRTSGAVF